jgi:hypothetical protein
MRPRPARKGRVWSESDFEAGGGLARGPGPHHASVEKDYRAHPAGGAVHGLPVGLWKVPHGARAAGGPGGARGCVLRRRAGDARVGSTVGSSSDAPGGVRASTRGYLPWRSPPRLVRGLAGVGRSRWYGAEGGSASRLRRRRGIGSRRRDAAAARERHAHENGSPGRIRRAGRRARSRGVRSSSGAPADVPEGSRRLQPRGWTGDSIRSSPAEFRDGGPGQARREANGVLREFLRPHFPTPVAETGKGIDAGRRSRRNPVQSPQPDSGRA